MKKRGIEIVIGFLVACIQRHSSPLEMVDEDLLEEALHVAVVNAKATEEVAPQVAVTVGDASSVSDEYQEYITKVFVN